MEEGGSGAEKEAGVWERRRTEKSGVSRRLVERKGTRRRRGSSGGGNKGEEQSGRR